jgi:uncharacterized protein YegJ (DUF2314 family)
MPLPFQRLMPILRRLDLLEWLFWFGLGSWGLYQFLAHGNPLGGLIGLVCLSTGCLQLAAHRFAWHGGLVAWGFCIVLSLGFIHARGLNIWRGAGVVGAVWGLVNHYRDRDRFHALVRSARGESEPGDAEERGPKHSLVFWLREPLYLDASLLGQAASRALDLRFGEGDDAEGFVAGEDRHFMMRVHDAVFVVHNIDAPYFDDPEAVAEDMREMRRAHAVRTHRAWLSVDLLHRTDAWSEDRVHDTLGRILAELAASGSAEVLAVFHPPTGHIAPWEPELREKLLSGAPLSLFENFAQAPVIPVRDDSPDMAAAVAEARRRWPEFVAAFQAAADKDRFSIKAPVTEAGRTEFIWIEVKAITADQVHGLLANDPVALGDLKLGSFVSVAIADLNDWVCPDPADPERPLGLFTVKAVQQAGGA